MPARSCAAMARLFGKAALGYICDWTNAVDLCALVSSLLLIVRWVEHVKHCDSVQLLRHADVAFDFFAVARRLQAGPGMQDSDDMFASIKRAVESSQAYHDAAAVCIFVTVLQFITVLDFHPKLGLTTSTIKLAGRDLAFFLFLFLFVLLDFAVLGVLLFGVENAQFATLSLSVMALVDILFGEFGSILDAKQDQQIFVVVFFYAFVCLSSLILLNALLAIIVDSYTTVKEQSKASSANSAPDIFAKLCRRCCGFCVPRKKVFIKVGNVGGALDKLLDKQKPTRDKLFAENRADSWEEMAYFKHDDVVLRSRNVLLVDLLGQLVAIDQNMLQTAFQITLEVPHTKHADCAERLLCFNILEQQGFSAENAGNDEEAGGAAVRALGELRHVSRFDPQVDPVMLLVLQLQAALYARPPSRAAPDDYFGACEEPISPLSPSSPTPTPKSRQEVSLSREESKSDWGDDLA